MKVLFVGVYVDNDLMTKVSENTRQKINVSYSAIRYAQLINEGLKHNIKSGVSNLFLVPLPMFPSSKILYWNKTNVDGNNYIPFINIILLKQLSIFLYVSFFTLKWYVKNISQEKKVVVFSFIYLPFLLAIAPLKFLKRFYVASFVPDMPEYEFLYTENLNRLKKAFIPLYIFLSKKIVIVNDYFIYISKYMVDNYCVRPYCIIEGFTNANDRYIDNNFSLHKNAIMYAGSLFEKFGIKLLLESFCQIQGNYELWLFGSGDMEKEIDMYSKRDSRIILFGNRPNAEVLEYQKKAKLLINPRFSSNEFTKYSFPSKLIEYMTSGTPVLTTRLLGIPNDYNDKMFYIDEETVSGLHTAILRCLNLSQEDLNDFGDNTRNYVIKNKNNFVQIKMVIDNFDLKFR